MSAADNGGPAFPVAGFMQECGAYSKFELAPHGGMTLRDYFAAKALTAVIRKNGADFKPEEWDRRAREAYGFADAMLRAREGKL